MNKKLVGVIVLALLGIIVIAMLSMKKDNNFNDYIHTDYDSNTIDKSDIVVTSPAKEVNEYTGNKALDTAISEIENQYSYSFIAVADTIEDSLTEQTFKYVLFEAANSERYEFVLRVLKDGTIAVQKLDEVIH